MHKSLWIVVITLATLQASELAAQDKASTSSEERMKTAKKLLEDAIAESVKRLGNQQCSILFGPEALEALRRTEFRIVSFGPPVLREGRPVVSAAKTIPNHKMVLINLDGPFVNEKLLVGGKLENFARVQPRTRSVALTQDDIRIAIILHELGHVLGKFGPDTKNVEDSHVHTDSVVQHCF
jgi:hypothetical protein